MLEARYREADFLSVAKWAGPRVDRAASEMTPAGEAEGTGRTAPQKVGCLLALPMSPVSGVAFAIT